METTLPITELELLRQKRQTVAERIARIKVTVINLTDNNSEVVKKQGLTEEGKKLQERLRENYRDTTKCKELVKVIETANVFRDMVDVFKLRANNQGKNFRWGSKELHRQRREILRLSGYDIAEFLPKLKTTHPLFGDSLMRRFHHVLTSIAVKLKDVIVQKEFQGRVLENNIYGLANQIRELDERYRHQKSLLEDELLTLSKELSLLDQALSPTTQGFSLGPESKSSHCHPPHRRRRKAEALLQHDVAQENSKLSWQFIMVASEFDEGWDLPENYSEALSLIKKMLDENDFQRVDAGIIYGKLTTIANIMNQQQRWEMEKVKGKKFKKWSKDDIGYDYRILLWICEADHAIRFYFYAKKDEHKVLDP